jgi:hypothetical protein
MEFVTTVLKRGSGPLAESGRNYKFLVEEAERNRGLGHIDVAVDNYVKAARNRKEAGRANEVKAMAVFAFGLEVANANEESSISSAKRAFEIAKEFGLSKSKGDRALALFGALCRAQDGGSEVTHMRMEQTLKKILQKSD